MPGGRRDSGIEIPVRPRMQTVDRVRARGLRLRGQSAAEVRSNEEFSGELAERACDARNDAMRCRMDEPAALREPAALLAACGRAAGPAPAVAQDGCPQRVVGSGGRDCGGAAAGSRAGASRDRRDVGLLERVRRFLGQCVAEHGCRNSTGRSGDRNACFVDSSRQLGRCGSREAVARLERSRRGGAVQYLGAQTARDLDAIRPPGAGSGDRVSAATARAWA